VTSGDLPFRSENRLSPKNNQKQKMLDQGGLDEFLGGDEFAFLSVADHGAASASTAALSNISEFRLLFQTGPFPTMPCPAAVAQEEDSQMSVDTTGFPSPSPAENGSISDEDSFETNDASVVAAANYANNNPPWESGTCVDCPLCSEQEGIKFFDSVLEFGKAEDAIKYESLSPEQRAMAGVFPPNYPPPQTFLGCGVGNHCQSKSKSSSRAGLSHRKIKHRELEVVRRRRMNAKFDELRDLLGPSTKKDKGTVLETAVNRLQTLHSDQTKLLALLDPTANWQKLVAEMEANVCCGIAVINSKSQFLNGNTYLWKNLLRFNFKEDLSRSSLLQVTAPGWLILLSECIRQSLLTRQTLCVRLEVISGMLSSPAVPPQNVFCECIVSPAPYPIHPTEGNNILLNDNLIVALTPVGIIQLFS
jgi:hypothetical protein